MNNTREFMGSKECDPKILSKMHKAEMTGNQREYRRLRSQLLKDYTDYQRFNQYGQSSSLELEQTVEKLQEAEKKQKVNEG